MIFVVRHGERADNAGPEEQKKIEIPFDPHLTELGKIQAKLAGEYIRNRVEKASESNNIKADHVKYLIVSSPFLRCLQTAYNISLAFNPNQIEGNQIYAENSICELLMTTYFPDSNPLPDLYLRKKPEEFKSLVPYPVQDGLVEPNKHLSTPVFPETIQKLQYRYELYEEIVKYYQKEKNKDGNVVMILVTHGYGIQAILEGLNSFDIYKGVEYTSVSEIVPNFDGKGVTKVTEGQVHAHLTKADEVYANTMLKDKV